MGEKHEDFEHKSGYMCPQNEDEDHDIKQRHYIAKTIQINSKDLLADVPASYNDLVDFLIEKNCLSHDEAPCFNDKATDNLYDKAARLISTITKRSYQTMIKFLECVEKFHPYIVKKINQTFKNCEEILEVEIKCDYCFLQSSVDLSMICRALWTKGQIECTLFDDVINLKSSKTGKELWKLFANECNSYDDKRKMSLIAEIRSELKERGQFCELVRRLPRLNSFDCVCDVVKKYREQTALEKMKHAKCLPPRQVLLKSRTDSTHSYSEVDGGISLDPITSVDCQDKRFLPDEPEEHVKKACLEKAIDLNIMALKDCMVIVLRSINCTVVVNE